MSKIPTVQKQLKHAKTSSTRGASLLGKGGSPEREFDATKNAATTSSTAMPRSHYEHDKRLTRKKSIDEQHECTSDDDASLVLDMPLAEQVEKFHPELLPLLHPHSLPDQHHSWKLDDVVDAVKLSFFLQDRLLCLPELNRNSPCYSARSIVLLYTKIKYLESFAPEQIAEYAGVGQQEYDEVRLLHQLKNVSSNAEMFSRLATLLHIPCHGDMWNEIIKFVACALPFAEQTESLLIRGSDERSVLCPSAKTNKYNGSTVPLSTDIARASCTCSSITLEGFQRCEKLRQELLLNSLSINPNSQSATEYFDAKMADVRHRIASSLGVTDLVQDGTIHVLLTPSGTDAELLATSAAFARMFSGLESLGGGSTRKKITSIISAQGEIGRGSASASGGKHFSELTPSGEPAVPGEPLRRYPTELVDVLELHGRDDDGNIKCIDEYVFQTVTRLLEDSEGPSVVLLHVVMGSKTGFNSPTMEIVDLLAATYPNRLLVVVDACQMRVNLRAFREFSAKGYITLVTGSKFFGGAPFCGAVLMPIRCVYEMETTAVEEHAELCHPLGLEDYFSKYEFPACMKHVRARLGRSNQFMNVGLLLRWESALAHMEPYAAIPHASVDAICRTYVTRTKQQLQSAKWCTLVELLEAPSATNTLDGSPSLSHARQTSNLLHLGERIAPMESIVSFKVWDACRQEHLDATRLRELHTLLSKDLSDALPDDAIAKTRCLLGQPVQLGKLPGAVLRIAMGADMVNVMYYRSLQEGTDLRALVDDYVDQDELILQKIELILRHWELVRQQYIEERVVHPLLELPKPLSDWNFSVKKTQIAQVVRKMRHDGLLGAAAMLPHQHYEGDESNKLAVVYDLDAIDMAFQALLTSFPSHFEHRFAMKSCPLSFFIKRAIENKVGIECASIIEVQHALRLGCPPENIVFDSPCKTRRDIAFAISAGVELNADNFDELQIIREHAEELFQSNFPECTPRFAGHLPRIGLRVNPLLGAGSNEYLSVSTVHSKFGTPLTPANRTKIIEFFKENPWMTGLHCHVGSQGCTLEMLAHGAKLICDLADEIDTAAGVSRVKVLNIGGGLPSNYDTDDVSPSFAEYVDVLRTCAPQLFERNGRTILTEFGRSVSAKTGWTISEVEYVKEHEVVACNNGDDASQQLTQTAIIHAGSDLFLRTCYVPALFPHRLSVYNNNGIASAAPLALQNIAGPLCFGGDLIGRRVELPRIARGDFVVIHDSGSNTISMFSRHCSRPAPAVYGYRSNGDDTIAIELLKRAETPEDVMRFWG